MWLNLYQQYIDEIGLESGFVNYIRLKKKLALNIAKYISSGDRFELNRINLLSDEVESLEITKPTEKIGQVVVSIEKYFGFIIDLKATSVSKYYNYIKLIESNSAKNG